MTNKTSNNFSKTIINLVIGFFAFFGIIVLLLAFGIWFSLTDKTKLVSPCNNTNGYKLEIIEKERWWLYGGTDTLFLRKDDNSKQIMSMGTADGEIAIPTVPRMYEEFEQIYEIKDIHNREVSTTATDLSSKVSLDEFKILGQCLEENKDKKEFRYLPNKIVYRKNVRVKTTNTSLVCNDQSKIKIKPDGDVSFEYFADKRVYDILGEFDKSNEFTRYRGKITTVSSPSGIPTYLQDKYDSSKNELVSIMGKSNNYQQLLSKDLAQKLYDQVGPKTDYLQTCKNTEGKTIFDVFKD